MTGDVFRAVLRLVRGSRASSLRGRPIPPTTPLPALAVPDFVAHDFEVWHTYTTYYDGPVGDLAEVAEGLVSEGVAYTAMLPDGRTFWRGDEDGGPLGFGITLFELLDNGARHRVQFIPGKDAPALSGFAQEAWFQACQFVAAESKLFRDDADVTPPAIRAFLGACMLGSEDTGRIWLYPILSLYESGVVVLHFRLLASKDPATLDVLIDDYVNLFRHSFELGLVPPPIAKLAPRADRVGYTPDRKLRNPITRWRRGRVHDRAIEEMTWTHDGGDFQWSLAPLSRLVMGEGETLTGVVHAIFDVVGLVAGRARTLTRPPWAPPGRLVKGNYWVGRPYVHLVRYTDQAPTATENEERHALAFAQLMMTTTGRAQRDRVLAHLPEDMRTFEDANAYLTRSLGLFAWSGQGLAQHGETLADRNSYVIESQVKVEVAEHAHMLARALYDTADTAAEADRVFDLRARLLRLRSALDMPSPFGEVSDMIRQALTAFGYDALTEGVQERLALREASVAARDRRRDERSRRALTLLFGLVAAPALATSLVAPIWTWMEWEVPVPPELIPVFYTGVSVVLIVLLALAAIGLTRRGS